jgi:hypothetical protein
MKKAIPFISLLLFVSFNLPVKTKTGKIAFLENNVPVFYSKAILIDRLKVEITEALNGTGGDDEQKVLIGKIEYDSLEIKKVNSTYYIFGYGLTGFEPKPRFVCYVQLLQKGNDLVIVSKQNPNVYSACLEYMKFTPREAGSDDVAYVAGDLDYFESPGKLKKKSSTSVSAFSENGLGLYLK